MPESIPDKHDRFIRTFEQSISCAAACRAEDIPYSTLQSWRSKDLYGFRARYMAANERRLDNLEERMFDLLNWATEEGNFAQALRYPTLLMFALKAGRPMYRDSVQAATGAADLLAAIAKLSDAHDNPAQPDEPVNEEALKRGIPPDVTLTPKQGFDLRKKLDKELRDILAKEEV